MTPVLAATISIAMLIVAIALLARTPDGRSWLQRCWWLPLLIATSLISALISLLTR